MAPTTAPTVLDGLYAKRQKVVDEWASAIESREQERASFEARFEGDDKPSEIDVEAYRSAEVAFTARNDQFKADIAAYDERIKDQLEMSERREAAAAAHKGVTTVNYEELTYSRRKSMGTVGTSYYRDLAQVAGPPGVSFQTTNRAESEARLLRHAQEMDKEMLKRAKSREKRAFAKVEDAEPGSLALAQRLGVNPFEYRVEPSTTQGQGGYFIPPLWLEDEYIPQLVAHLVAAALCRQMDLPMGTDSINIPKVSGGTAVGYQQANNSGVVTQDWTDTSVQANVKTIAGDSDVALQLLEQSPHGLVDEVITMNLMQQYNAFLDQQVLAGDGVNTSQLNGGHLLGLYPSANWSGTNSVTYTASAPAGFQFAQVLGAMASQVAKTRFNAANFRFVLHGRRWFWYSTAPDGNDRPLGETSAGGPWNVQAILDDGLVAEGLVGRLPHVANVPVYIDDNVPITDTTGGGSAQDVAIGGLWDDAWLFQGALRTNVYREVLSSALGVRFQIYNYVAFLIRYGQSFAIGTGSGFAAPTGQNTTPAWTYASTLF